MSENTNTRLERRLGLNKNARLTAEREKKAAEDRPKPLDPPFPYRVVPFDPRFVW